jgi:hypothetical protein
VISSELATVAKATPRPICYKCRTSIEKWTVTIEEDWIKFEAEYSEHGYEMVRIKPYQVVGLQFLPALDPNRRERIRGEDFGEQDS